MEFRDQYARMRRAPHRVYGACATAASGAAILIQDFQICKTPNLRFRLAFGSKGRDLVVPLTPNRLGYDPAGALATVRHLLGASPRQNRSSDESFIQDNDRHSRHNGSRALS